MRFFRFWLGHLVLLLFALLHCGLASAQACAGGFVGPRTIKSYWIEGGSVLVIVPNEPFANPCGCTKSDQAFISATDSHYRATLAAVMQALASNTPIDGYTTSCLVYWGNQTWPKLSALGVGGRPN